MPPRLASHGLASLFSIAALAGCSASDGARFAGANPSQLARAYGAASGGELLVAVDLGNTYAGQNNTGGCPKVATQGQDTTVTFGCITADATRLEGSISIHNLPGFGDNPAYDAAQPSWIELDFSTAHPRHGERKTVGRVEIAGAHISGDLLIESGGNATASRLVLDCEGDGSCTAASGSEIELSDLGRADVEGAWSLGAQPSGGVVVSGADVLVFDMAGREASGCVPYATVGKRGTVCVPYPDWDAAHSPAR